MSTKQLVLAALFFLAAGYVLTHVVEFVWLGCMTSMLGIMFAGFGLYSALLDRDAQPPKGQRLHHVKF